MMNIHEYAKSLMRFKGQDLSLLKFLGARWIALKALLAIVGIVGLLHPNIILKCVGVFLLGYAFGAAIAGIRSQLVARRRWLLQQQLYDWAKIESLAKDEPAGENA